MRIFSACIGYLYCHDQQPTTHLTIENIKILEWQSKFTVDIILCLLSILIITWDSHFFCGFICCICFSFVSMILFIVTINIIHRFIVVLQCWGIIVAQGNFYFAWKIILLVKLYDMLFEGGGIAVWQIDGCNCLKVNIEFWIYLDLLTIFKKIKVIESKSLIKS